jgi:hypothetical protein
MEEADFGGALPHGGQDGPEGLLGFNDGVPDPKDMLASFGP